MVRLDGTPTPIVSFVILTTWTGKDFLISIDITCLPVEYSFQVSIIALQVSSHNGNRPRHSLINVYSRLYFLRNARHAGKA